MFLMQHPSIDVQVPADKCEFLEQSKEFKGKSEPLFLLYRVRCQLGYHAHQSGDTASCSTQALNPKYAISQSRTQNGQLKSKIEGANTPLLSSQILTWTPANADMDDLEVSSRGIAPECMDVD
jgi:hypothetical protein